MSTHLTREIAPARPNVDRISLDSMTLLDLLPFRPGVVDGVVFRALTTYRDPRGSLCELFRQDELPADFHPAMAYFSETLPGVARGPHEHLQQTDYFSFLGTATFHLYLWDNRAESPSYLCHEIAVLREGQAMSVIVPPGVVHAYRNVGQVAGWVINCPNRLYRGEGRADPVDEVRHEDDPRSVFRMLK